MKSKKRIVFIVIVLIAITFAMIGAPTNESENEVITKDYVELSSEIVYSGKVLPKTIVNQYLSPTKVLKRIQVVRNQTIYEGDIICEFTDGKQLVSNGNFIVYQIDEVVNEKKDYSRPFITLLSLEKVIRIEVSEYEVPYFVEGDAIKIKLANQSMELIGKIEIVDLLPNNLENIDLSYYDVEISLDSDLPYGTSVMVIIEMDSTDD